MDLIELSFCGEVYAGGGTFVIYLSNKCAVLCVNMMNMVLTSSNLGEQGVLLSFISYLF